MILGLVERPKRNLRCKGRGEEGMEIDLRRLDMCMTCDTFRRRSLWFANDLHRMTYIDKSGKVPWSSSVNAPIAL